MALALILRSPSPKDSSWCTELMLFGLHRAAVAGKDLRIHEVILQADNTPRECKNNVLLRIAGALTGLRKVRRMELRFLSVGHSHEDLDQWFSVSASLIESHPELHVPEDFLCVLNEYLAKPESRPHENDRSVLWCTMCGTGDLGEFFVDAVLLSVRRVFLRVECLAHSGFQRSPSLGHSQSSEAWSLGFRVQGLGFRSTGFGVQGYRV